MASRGLAGPLGDGVQVLATSRDAASTTTSSRARGMGNHPAREGGIS